MRTEHDELRNLPTDLGAGVRFFLLLGCVLGLLSGCSSTVDKDSAPGNAPDVSGIKDAVPKVEPKSKYGNPKSYVVFGKRYHTKSSSKGHVERGLASWYGKKFHGRKTSSGERYDMYAMTAAHKTLPLPTYARVTNVETGRSAVVKINDRGPFHGKRVIDLSYTAARKLGVVSKGTAMVEVRAIDPKRPESNQDGQFLAAAAKTPKSKSKTQARKRAVVVRNTPTKKKYKPVSRVEEAPVQIAAAKKPAAPSPKVAVAKTREKPRQASGSSMYLQVGAFGNRTNAEQLRRQLANNVAEQVQVRTADGKKTPLYKVHVGPLDSRTKAKDVSQQLASLGLKHSHIVVE
jgi:rare lipoprotein A